MDLHAFYTGASFTAHHFFGAHPTADKGVMFRVYAPNAQRVELIGTHNQWQGQAMVQQGSSGVYELYCGNAAPGDLYKYRITGANGIVHDRSDPYGFATELRPQCASLVVALNTFSFTDEAWMRRRPDKLYTAPLNIYEVHAGSWKKPGDAQTDWYTYRELADLLVPYARENGYTHLELLPLAEHPFDGSWGYQQTGFFSPTSRYGTPADLQYFVNLCHQNEIGVILDFVPVHFAVNDFALSRFDGTALYEYPDTDTGYNEWGSCNFNYYRGEVRSFLQSAAYYWIEFYHFDGLRIDAVSNALYWQGNAARGVNPGAVDFIKNFNTGLETLCPHVLRIAEDSTNFPKVTAPVAYGGLGFDYKWDMGWMNDTLQFFTQPFATRRQSYHKLTFSMDYFYNELYLLALSHDESVHGKKTVLDKMWGTYEEKFAGARALYAYMYTHPGKKLNFMGGEFGQLREWDETRAQDWALLQYPAHDSFFAYCRALHALYHAQPALYAKDYDSACFCWFPVEMGAGCVYAFARKAPGAATVLTVLNAGAERYDKLLVGVQTPCVAKEVLNSNEARFGGDGAVNAKPVRSKNISLDRCAQTLQIKLAPLSAAVFVLPEH